MLRLKITGLSNNLAKLHIYILIKLNVNPLHDKNHHMFSKTQVQGMATERTEDAVGQK